MSFSLLVQIIMKILQTIILVIYSHLFKEYHLCRGDFKSVQNISVIIHGHRAKWLFAVTGPPFHPFKKGGTLTSSISLFLLYYLFNLHFTGAFDEEDQTQYYQNNRYQLCLRKPEHEPGVYPYKLYQQS